MKTLATYFVTGIVFASLCGLSFAETAKMMPLTPAHAKMLPLQKSTPSQSQLTSKRSI